MNQAESEAEAIINRLIDCQMVAAINNTELAEYYLSESEWQIVEDYLRFPGRKPTRPKPGFIGVLCGTPIVIQESTMKQPTKEQLNDPKWWDANAPKTATYVDEHGIFYKTHSHKMFAYTEIGQSFYWLETKPIARAYLNERPEQEADRRGPQDWVPPVNTECLASWLEPPDGGGRLPEPVLIKGYHGDKRRQVWFTRANGEDMIHLVANCYFEPIQSERERLLKMAVESLSGLSDTFVTDAIEDLAGQLFDAGMLVDPDKKLMGRSEAYGLFRMETKLTNEAINSLLNALGYKEE